LLTVEEDASAFIISSVHHIILRRRGDAWLRLRAFITDHFQQQVSRRADVLHANH